MTPEFETTWFTMAGSIAVALGLGLMVGLEREQFQSRVEDRKFGGIRTFSLLGLLGAIGGEDAQLLGPRMSDEKMQKLTACDVNRARV